VQKSSRKEGKINTEKIREGNFLIKKKKHTDLEIQEFYLFLRKNIKTKQNRKERGRKKGRGDRRKKARI
jgi:hypothetical protein